MHSFLFLALALVGPLLAGATPVDREANVVRRQVLPTGYGSYNNYGQYANYGAYPTATPAFKYAKRQAPTSTSTSIPSYGAYHDYGNYGRYGDYGSY